MVLTAAALGLTLSLSACGRRAEAPNGGGSNAPPVGNEPAGEVRLIEAEYGPFDAVTSLEVSPDGGWVAFSAVSGESLELWLAPVRGPGAPKAKRLARYPASPGLSAEAVGWLDAQTAVFRVGEEQPPGPNAGLRGVALLAAGPERALAQVAWLPLESAYLNQAWVIRAEGLVALHVDGALWTANPASGEVRLVAELPQYDFFRLTPAPDGVRAAFTASGPSLSVLDLASGRQTLVASGPDLPFVPVWSPGGSRLAFLEAQQLSGGSEPEYDAGLGEGPEPPATRLAVATFGGGPGTTGGGTGTAAVVRVELPGGLKVGEPVWASEDRLLALGARFVDGLSGAVTPETEGEGLPGEFELPAFSPARYESLWRIDLSRGSAVIPERVAVLDPPSDYGWPVVASERLAVVASYAGERVDLLAVAFSEGTGLPTADRLRSIGSTSDPAAYAVVADGAQFLFSGIKTDDSSGNERIVTWDANRPDELAREAAANLAPGTRHRIVPVPEGVLAVRSDERPGYPQVVEVLRLDAP